VFIKNKVNYSIFVQTGLIALILGGIGVRFRKELFSILASPFMRGVAIIGFTTTMTSGYMWNRIRKPAPYGIKQIAKDKTAFEYISTSLQQQYGIESRVVFGLGTKFL
jgi:hypothetical protein